ncbi:MAG: nuclear transport factor 2 family protein [Prochloraceae cyanobacterium]|nr:nuclear transport factor 2 family protein [Prochloraceae cyanobacterium]
MNLAQSNSQTASNLNIEGISEPVVKRYFETINAGNFEATANLFAPEGALHPPFESPVVGYDAIATYLQTEAEGMLLFPARGIAETLDDDNIRIEIEGKVRAPLFSVNVAWQFIVNPCGEILHVQVKLLASVQELLKIKPDRLQQDL